MLEGRDCLAEEEVEDDEEVGVEQEFVVVKAELEEQLEEGCWRIPLDKSHSFLLYWTSNG